MRTTVRLLVVCLLSAVVMLAPATYRATGAPAGFPAQTTLEIRQGVLALAGWALNDPFHSHVMVAGNDVFNINVYGIRVFRYTSVLVSIYQRFCDIGTDEWVVRDFSTLPMVDPRNVVVDQGLNHATVNVSLDLTGIESRSPNCATPGDRQFSSTPIPITLSFRWSADAENRPFDQFIAQDVAPGSAVVVFKVVGGYRSATVTGSISSPHPDFNFQLDNTGAYLSFIVRDSFLTIQVFP